MIAFNDSRTTTTTTKEEEEESMMKLESDEKCLDSQLWHACAGNMVHIPQINSKVFYFPQGHAEHAYGNVDFGGNFSRIPALTLCRVGDVKFKADPETDEVYVKMRLFPLRRMMMMNESIDYDDDGGGRGGGGGGGGGGVLCNNNNSRSEGHEKASSFSKTLTQSDANNGGGFSVPRYCAETIFPRLDYSAEPPVQTVLAKDVHGEVWKFRHIYRGTPRRHLLTTGWSTFVNQKKLIAGDSIVFLRTESGDLCVGIRRLKKDGGPESVPSGWNPNPNPNPNPTPGGNCVPQYGGFSVFLREDENKQLLLRNVNGGGSSNSTSEGGSGSGSGSLKGRQRVRPESVIEAANLAANGQPFEIVYYPRASTPEFFVKASAVKTAMRIQWCHGMRFKMAFETEDSSRISWFMGTISSVQVADPVRWPNSPWRLLQVSWDEPELLQNVKRVSPWLVELVSNMPAIHLSPFSPPRKKMRLPQHPDFIFDGQLALPPFSSNSLGPSICYLADNTPAGIQGARHVQFGTPLPDLHLNKLHSGLFPTCFQRFDPGPPPSRISNNISMSNTNTNEDVSCTLTIGNSSPSLKKSDEGKTPQFVLFGKPIIVAQQQISVNCSGDTVSPVHTGNTSSDVNLEKAVNLSDSASALYRHGRQENPSCDGFPWSIDRQTTDPGLETGHCKVFLEKEDVGRTLDLSVLGSYEELYRKLATMFGIERSEMMNHVRYQDATGTLRQTGDEPFSEFMKTAKRLTVLMDSGGDNREKRKWITGLGNAEIGINTTTTNKAGALSIFA